MDLSTLNPQQTAALANMTPDGFLRATGAFGRKLTEGGTSDVEEQHRYQLKRAHTRVLKEVSTNTRFAGEDIEMLWKAAKYGDMSIRKLSESVSEFQLPQLLRFGVQNFLFDGYASVPTIYPDLVRVVQSSGAEELYAPLYGVELPKNIAPGQEFGDSRLQGLDVHVQNLKRGRMLTVERELVDDDRTGQIVTRAGQLGERMRYVEEQDVINAITGGTYNTTIGNITVTALATPLPGQLSQPLIEAADIALEGMLDPLGNKMLVLPDTLLVSSADKFNAAKLLQSALQPSVPGASGQTANTASSGGTGWTMTVNPLQGLYNLKVSRFMPTSGGLDGVHGYAFLMEAKKSLVFQDRDALEVVQEAANSGGSFERDIYRYRARRRYAAALIESRYVFRIV
jgi:hypothetical protein